MKRKATLHCFSLSWVDSWCKREGVGRERAGSNADESSTDYVPKNSVRGGFENLGSLSNAHSQADYQFAKSIGNLEADRKCFRIQWACFAYVLTFCHRATRYAWHVASKFLRFQSFLIFRNFNFCFEKFRQYIIQHLLFYVRNKKCKNEYV